MILTLPRNINTRRRWTFVQLNGKRYHIGYMYGFFWKRSEND